MRSLKETIGTTIFDDDNQLSDFLDWADTRGVSPEYIGELLAIAEAPAFFPPMEPQRREEIQSARINLRRLVSEYENDK